MESIYVIVRESSELGAIEVDRDVEFVTADKDVAMKYFYDMMDFCLETKNSNWYYMYILYEYGDGKDRHMRKTICSFNNL